MLWGGAFVVLVARTSALFFYYWAPVIDVWEKVAGLNNGHGENRHQSLVVPTLAQQLRLQSLSAFPWNGPALRSNTSFSVCTGEEASNDSRVARLWVPSLDDKQTQGLLISDGGAAHFAGWLAGCIIVCS